MDGPIDFLHLCISNTPSADALPWPHFTDTADGAFDISHIAGNASDDLKRLIGDPGSFFASRRPGSVEGPHICGVDPETAEVHRNIHQQEGRGGEEIGGALCGRD